VPAVLPSGNGQKFLYVLTNRRALVWGPKWNGTVVLVTYGPRALSSIHVRGNNVVFHTMTTISHDQKGEASARTALYGFVEIEDAPAVERLIRETLLDPFLNKAYE
jgi:hypothetical protein